MGRRRGGPRERHAERAPEADMTANETTLSRLLAAAGAVLRAVVPTVSPVMAGGPAMRHVEAPRASFGGQKNEAEASSRPSRPSPAALKPPTANENGPGEPEGLDGHRRLGPCEAEGTPPAPIAKLIWRPRPAPCPRPRNPRPRPGRRQRERMGLQDEQRHQRRDGIQPPR